MVGPQRAQVKIIKLQLSEAPVKAQGPEVELQNSCEKSGMVAHTAIPTPGRLGEVHPWDSLASWLVPGQ